MELRQLAERPDSDLNAVVALLERDAALATAVLRVASSTGYRSALAPTTLRQAVTRVGLGTIRNLSMQVSLTQAFHSHGQSVELTEELAHAYAVASGASLLARASGIDPSAAFLAGLLHDVGRLAVLILVTDLARNEPCWRSATLREHTLDALHEEAGPTVLAR